MLSSFPPAVWEILKNHQTEMEKIHLRDLFVGHPDRFNDFSIKACGLLLDYSKNHINFDTRDLLLTLAEQNHLEDWRDTMFTGENINHTEYRPALHIALRNLSNTPIYVKGENVMPRVNAVLDRMFALSEKVRDGEWLGYTGKPIEHIVNIGIGGSDLGPKMVCEALQAYQHQRLTAHFVSNVDACLLDGILNKIDPETTLFIVASKTFTTQETITNACSARRWLIEQLGDEKAVSQHFVAVSTNHQAVSEFGIDLDNMFEFWDWVGGRYSLWSAIGLSIAIMLGKDQFKQLLGGAHGLDEHFRTAPLAQNLPVMLALIGVWNSSFFNCKNQAILSYDYALRELPAYLQQLEMESTGKRVMRDGHLVSYNTCPVIFGAPGNNGQHAFYQMFHQGTQRVPCDFIVAVESQVSGYGDHQDKVLANAIAQSRALMLGRDEQHTAQLLNMQADECMVQHRTFPGNQPSNTLLYQKLTPTTLGALIALYEHKVFVQSVCWGLNPFDQWGVELGKTMASALLPALQDAAHNSHYDASTEGLLRHIHGLH